MIDFPNSPTVGQVVTAPNGTAWRWTGSTWLLAGGGSSGGGGSGFTFVAETKPTPTRQGDTWLNVSTGASGGVSYVAVYEDPSVTSSELVWVQFSPGAGGSVQGALGMVGYAQLIATSAGYNITEQAITNMTATFTAQPNRAYKVSAQIRIAPTTAGNRFIMSIRDGSVTGTRLAVDDASPSTLNANESMNTSVVWRTPPLGLHTMVTTIVVATGAGTVSVIGAADAPCFILIEDVGAYS